MSEVKAVDWNALGVTWSDDGSATIALSFEINVGGVKGKSLVMLCPSLDQAEAIDNDKNGTALQRERRGIASLMGVTEGEMGQLKFPDYRRLQAVYECFFGGTPPMFVGSQSASQSSGSPGTSTSA
ncbi:MAG: phage tail assembly protein [Rhodospirillaceae bacterium]|nr:phage tail assembly protein [Rhodospirillales bacterium]